MKKLLSLFTILCTSTAFISAADLTTQDLWFSASAWLRNYIIDRCANLPSVDISSLKYIQTNEDLGRSLTPYYGKAIADEFTQYMREQGKLTISLIDAIKNKDSKGIKTIQDSWKLNVTVFCNFLNKNNPYLRFEAMRNMFYDYLKRMSLMIQSRVDQQWQKDANEYDAFQKQTAQIGQAFTQALSDAFPFKNKDLETPKRLIPEVKPRNIL